MDLRTLKLFRFGPPGRERPGVCLSLPHGELAWDVSSWVPDYDEAFFRGGGVGSLEALLAPRLDSCPRVRLEQVRIGAPLTRPSKLLGIGLNYRAHARETGAEVPADPKIFMKATSAISGPNDDLVLPRGGEHTDYEVELALVIGTQAKYVTRAAALGHIAGYLMCNDYSERDWQKNRHGQFVKGKSADGFAPLGPFLVPADRLDPGDLRLWLSVNGEMRQDARTSDMVFDCAELVSRLSQYMTLLPGDVITTGTPHGVGLGRVPPVFLRPGDVVEYGIEGLGRARQLVRDSD